MARVSGLIKCEQWEVFASSVNPPAKISKPCSDTSRVLAGTTGLVRMFKSMHPEV